MPEAYYFRTYDRSRRVEDFGILDLLAKAFTPPMPQACLSQRKVTGRLSSAHSRRGFLPYNTLLEGVFRLGKSG